MMLQLVGLVVLLCVAGIATYVAMGTVLDHRRVSAEQRLRVRPGPLPIPPYPRWDNDWAGYFSPSHAATRLEGDGYYFLDQTQNDDGTWTVALSRADTPGGKRRLLKRADRLDSRQAAQAWDRWYIGLESALAYEKELSIP
jgi:hypothetical protein